MKSTDSTSSFESYGKSSFAFLDLPREIRDQVYGDLLLLNKAPWLLDHGPAILYTNKQIHAEASKVLYGGNRRILVEDDTGKIEDNLSQLSIPHIPRTGSHWYDGDLAMHIVLDDCHDDENDSEDDEPRGRQYRSVLVAGADFGDLCLAMMLQHPYHYRRSWRIVLTFCTPSKSSVHMQEMFLEPFYRLHGFGGADVSGTASLATAKQLQQCLVRMLSDEPFEDLERKVQSSECIGDRCRAALPSPPYVNHWEPKNAACARRHYTNAISAIVLIHKHAIQKPSESCSIDGQELHRYIDMRLSALGQKLLHVFSCDNENDIEDEKASKIAGILHRATLISETVRPLMYLCMAAVGRKSANWSGPEPKQRYCELSIYGLKQAQKHHIGARAFEQEAWLLYEFIEKSDYEPTFEYGDVLFERHIGKFVREKNNGGWTIISLQNTDNTRAIGSHMLARVSRWLQEA
ncbi:MAG: hypothetical protein Q9222_003951 [Ikaeria aurantiellina]